uniref:WW domain-containing protein n=1 Tax=Chrysotila carterae TaxID=13221 RepID=A0A7S4B2B8_CHRCT
MAEEASLPPNWEEVHDPEGRSYWWNVETNETTWMRPTNVVAKKSIAAGYLAKVQEAEKQVASPKVLKSSVKKDLPPVISTGTGVASLTKKFASCTTDSAPSGSGCGSPAAAARLSDSAATSAGGQEALLLGAGRSSARSVSALKKYQVRVPARTSPRI